MPRASRRSLGAMGGKLDADEDLVGAGSVGLGNVDILKTVDGVAKSCELNSTHIDISFVEAASSAWTGGNQRPWVIPCILPLPHPFLLYACPRPRGCRAKSLGLTMLSPARPCRISATTFCLFGLF